MSTTTMSHDAVPALASRRTPAPMTWDEHHSLAAQAGSTTATRARDAELLRIVAQSTGQTAWASPPPSQTARFAAQVMWALLAVVVLRCGAFDLLAFVWSVITR